MKFKYSLPCLLLLVVMLTGCGHNFDSSGYVTSIMDTLYKGNYTSYMDFTGVSRSDVSLYRDQWLTSSAEAFMTAFGAGTPSEETTDRIIALLNQLYANASYEVTAETPASDGSPQTVQLSIRPLNILKDNYDAIQAMAGVYSELLSEYLRKWYIGRHYSFLRGYPMLWLHQRSCLPDDFQGWSVSHQDKCRSRLLLSGRHRRSRRFFH